MTTTFLFWNIDLYSIKAFLFDFFEYCFGLRVYRKNFPVQVNNNLSATVHRRSKIEGSLKVLWGIDCQDLQNPNKPLLNVMTEKKSLSVFLWIWRSTEIAI